METRLAADESARLSDQKADDWRSISDVTPTLFGVAGAIFGAGIASSSALVLAIAPLPLFLGIFHMVRNARLQMQMIVFLALHGAEAWESESSAVRDAVYRAMEGDSPWQKATWWFRKPSSWNTWLVIALVTTVLVNATGAMAGYHHWEAGLLVGLSGGVAAAFYLKREISTIERDRKVWTVAWEAEAAGRDIEAAARAALGRPA
jgi:hypothetical protein